MSTLFVARSSDPPWFFFILMIVALVVGLLYAVERAKEMKQALQRLAQRLDGRLSDGGLFERPSLAFTLAGRPARFEFYSGSKNSPPYSRLEVSLTERSPGTLHILPEGFGQGFLKFFGAQDLEVGDPRFDSEYVLRASPDSLVEQVFNPSRRDRVMASVRRLSGFRYPTIDLERSRLTVQVREYCADDARLMFLVTTAEDFLRYLFGTPAPVPVPGVELGEVLTSGGECPVCGTPMTEGLVRCETCQTPHHLECWDYAGRCSTFGCAGRRAVL